MKSVSNEYKEQLTALGRQYNVLVTYTQDNQQVELSNSELNIVTPHYEGDLLKSVMKQLDLDSNVDIPIGTEINCQFGLKTRSGKNLFDSKNANVLNAYFSSEQVTIASNSVNRTIYIPCKSNTTYTMQKINSAQFWVGYTYELPAVGVRVYGRTNTATVLDANHKYITFTTDEDAKYIVARIYQSAQDTSITLQEVLDTIQIEEGNQATSYEEFGEYDYIDYGNYIVYSSEKQEDLKSYKIVCYDKMLNAMKDYEALQLGKNLLPQDKYANTTTKNGVTYTNNGDGTFNLTGTATANTVFQITPYDLFDLEANQPYYLYSSVPYNATNFNMSIPMNDNGTTKYLLANNTYTPTATPTLVRLQFYIASGNSVNQTNIKLMLTKGTTPTEYQPYLQTTFPMSVKDYLTTLSYNLNIPLATQSFVNDGVEISSEKYLDENGGNLGYTYRDVLDDLAQVTASTICINENDGLEVRYIKNYILPTGYKQLDYVQSDETNVINTGVIPTANIDVEIDIDDITTTNQFGSPFGYREANTNQFWWYIMPGNGQFVARWGENNYNSTFYYTTGERVKVRQNKNGLYVNGTLVTSAFTSATITSSKNIYIFACNNTGSSQWQINGKLYGCKIWNNGVLIRNYVPCIRNNDNKVGVYDLINNEFYTKQGTNEFTYGEVILDSIEEFDETWLKDTNVNFKEKYGPINSVVFSRSGDSDLIFRKDDTSIEQNGLCELKIKDNQLLNENDRDNFIDGVFNQLSGLEFYMNDYTSTGITILELCDKYNVKVGENIYPCVMFNDELNVTQGFDEMVHTDKPETSESDYKKADTTDRRINQAYIIVDKQNQEITALTSRTNNLATQVNNDKQEILNKFGDYALNSSVDSLTTQVNTIQTDTYTKTEVSQILKGTFYDANNNQVVSEVVKTISGTFDENGMTYAKTNAKTSTTINEVGVRVNNTTSSDELLFAGYDNNISQTIVRTDNLLVRNFLNIGSNSRLQDYETGTGVFDI